MRASRRRRCLAADARRAARQGVYAFELDEAPARLEAWCAAYGPGGDGQWGRVDVEEHIRDEHSTFTWLLEAMIDRSGFTIERTEYSGDGVFAAYVLRAPST